jgi:hypothetical protein
MLRGAFIRSVHLSNPDDNKKTVSAQCTADFSTPVIEKMKWGQVADGTGEFTPINIDGVVSSCKLKGALLATSLILTPSQKEMKKHELDLDISWLGDFQAVVTKDREGEPTNTELRFTFESNSDKAAAQLENYINHLGREKCQMKVAYAKQLILGEAEEEESDAQQTTNDGEDEPVEVGAGSVASVREMKRNAKA